MERSLEDWLRAMSSLGVPPPTPQPPASFAPSAPLPPFAGARGVPPNLFAPALPPPAAAPETAPAEAPAPVAPPPVTDGFAAAPFQPPRAIARPGNQDLFGSFMETVGLRTPPAPPPLMLPPRPEDEPDPVNPLANVPPLPYAASAPPSDPRVLATQNQRRGMSYRPSPALERRYPQASRMSRLLDRAREQKGWV